MINVTKTLLSLQIEHIANLRRIWDTVWVTKRDGLIRKLKEKPLELLEAQPFRATANGSLPLQIWKYTFRLSGEIITTPFSFVAKATNLVWVSYCPMLVDIHTEYHPIHEKKIDLPMRLN